MTEEFATKLAEARAKQLRWPAVSISAREETLFSGTERLFAEPDTLFFIISADSGISVSSLLGRYNRQSNALTTQAHEHADRVVVKNVETDRRSVFFVVAKRVELPLEPEPAPVAAPKPPAPVPKSPDAAPKPAAAVPGASAPAPNGPVMPSKPPQTAPNAAATPAKP